MRRDLLLVTLLLGAVTLGAATQGINKMWEDDAVGMDVVDAATKIIKSKLFVEDSRDFIRGIAFVETAFGTNGTHPGGIWRITPAWFAATQQNSFAPLHDKIRAEFPHVDWKNTPYSKLKQPGYSALAAYLFMCEDFASSGKCSYALQEKDQGAAWARKYGVTEHENPVNYYVNRMKELHDLDDCVGRFIAVMVMDASGSIDPADFVKQKEIVNDVFESNREGHAVPGVKGVTFGVITYSDSSEVSLPLNTALNMNQIKILVSNIHQPRGGTATSLAIDQATSIITQYKTSADKRPAAMIVLTDGASNSFANTVAAAERSRAAGITGYGVGIGNYKEVELDAIAGSRERVFTTENFDQLKDELMYWINKDSCSLPQEAPINGTADDELAQGQKRYYALELPFEGVVLNVRNLQGNVRAYYSYSFENPNSAYYDGEIRGETFIENLGVRAAGQVVYIGVVGEESFNQYELNAQQAEGCGLSGTSTVEFNIGQVSASIPDGTVIWEHPMYFEAARSERNPAYLDMEFGQKFLLKAGRRFSEYLSEGGDPNLVSKVAFHCSFGARKEYTLRMQVVP